MEPYPIGTRVEYHGSLKHKHGVYEITEHWGLDQLKHMRPDIRGHYTDEQIAAKYPDYTAYVMWEVGAVRKFGNRDKQLHAVRRESITPVEDPDEEVRKFLDAAE